MLGLHGTWTMTPPFERIDGVIVHHSLTMN